MRQLPLFIAAPVLAVEPGLEKAAQLAIERALQLRLLPEQLRKPRVERQLEIVLTRRGLVQARDLRSVGRAPRLRADLQRLLEPERREPIAQHLVPLLARER